MTLEELKAKGFVIGPATIGEGLISVWHQQPFRYFNPKFIPVNEGRAHATVAEPTPGGGFLIVTTPMALPKGPADDFGFAFIMENSIAELDNAAAEVARLSRDLQTARDTLMCLVKDSTLY